MIAQEVLNFRATVRRHQVPQLSVATGAKSTNLSKIPDRDTILNSPTVVRGDPDALVSGHYQPAGLDGAVMSEDLERELSGGI
jgi:hypothetical protein